MVPFVGLLILGCLLIPFGSFLLLFSIPITSWDAPWAEIKDAFKIMVHRRRFQVGLICIVVGMLLLWYLLRPILL